ncbi:MAG TPA: hemerythrin family protein [Syntrophomonadaceae bacterium]|nr:hemerythrin family protein [Syntrophomonadaceae bacterium]
MMWKEKYKIGVELVDGQHKELFNRISDFVKIVQDKKSSWDEKVNQVKETMYFMQDYVVTHFADEEKYMAEIDYPELEEHKKIHADFKAGVFNYVNRLETEGYSEELAQEFGAKIMAWLIMHVAATDQKIGAYVRSKEEGSI